MSFPPITKKLLSRAEQGDPTAQVALGRYSQRILKDHAEAAKWFQKAAEQGDAEGQHNLAHLYDIGQGVAQDSVVAEQLFRKAAEQGHHSSQQRLGEYFAKGRPGVSPNVEEGYFWLLVASQTRRDRYSDKYLLGETFDAIRDNVAGCLIPEQVSAVQKRANEWKPTHLQPANNRSRIRTAESPQRDLFEE